MSKKTQSKVSPSEGSERGCLCKNGKYNKRCCDGSLQAQGIGKVSSTRENDVVIIESNGTKTITHISN